MSLVQQYSNSYMPMSYPPARQNQGPSTSAVNINIIEPKAFGGGQEQPFYQPMMYPPASMPMMPPPIYGQSQPMTQSPPPVPMPMIPPPIYGQPQPMTQSPSPAPMPMIPPPIYGQPQPMTQSPPPVSMPMMPGQPYNTQNPPPAAMPMMPPPNMGPQVNNYPPVLNSPNFVPTDSYMPPTEPMQQPMSGNYPTGPIQQAQPMPSNYPIAPMQPTQPMQPGQPNPLGQPNDPLQSVPIGQPDSSIIPQLTDQDIPRLNNDLNSNDLLLQGKAISDIATLGFGDQETFKGLSNIIKQDNSKLGDQDKQLAQENKKHAMWTIAIMNKNQNPNVPISDLPGSLEVAKVLNLNPDPVLRKAAIAALDFMKKDSPMSPEDKALLNDIYSMVVKKDKSQEVKNTAKNAMSSLTK